MITALFLLHLFLIAAYAAYSRLFKRDGASRFLAELALLSLLPFFGFLLLLLLRISHKSNAQQAEDLSALYGEFKKTRSVAKLGRLQNADIIPVQDLLLFEDPLTRRNALTRVIKQDQLDNPSILLDAVRDKDTEIAHYAVSIMTHRIAKLELKLNRLRKKVSKTPDDLLLQKKYAALLKHYLKDTLLDANSRSKWRAEYEAALNAILLKEKNEKLYWVERVELALSIKDYHSARKYGLAFFKRFSDQEEAYLLYMRYCHLTGRYTMLHRTLQRLKSSRIPFSPTALETVRFWDQGGQHAS